MRKVTNKKIAAVAVAAVALTGTGVAYAYWTTTGSGTGSATTSDGVTDTVQFAATLNSADAPISNLAPGVAAQAFDAAVTNDDPNEKVYVTDIHAYLTVTKATGAPTGTCDATDYVLGTSAAATVASVMPVVDGDVVYDEALAVELTWTAQELDENEGSTDDVAGFIGFNNKTTNQDACKGATVTVNYVAS